jgi:hypothetical protein
VVVFLHGALRDAGTLIPWVDLLADVADVVLVDLPGHGRSDAIEPATVDAISAAVLDMLKQALSSRELILVGESLGGTVALAIGGKADPAWIRGVIAADPPLTTAKQWATADYFRTVMRVVPDNAFIPILARDAFGISETEIEEIVYYPLIGNLLTPAIIATGDVPLLPPRVVEGAAPCVFDATDRIVLESQHPGKVGVHQIPNCGHLLLVDARPACLELIKSMIRRHTSANVSGADG